MKQFNCDVLVVGAGIAGLRAAMQCSSADRKTIVAYLGSGASPNVFGFSALLKDSPVDSFETFRDDLMRSGGGINDPEIVAALINNSTTLEAELAEIGYITVPRKRVKGQKGGAGHSVSRGNSSDKAVGPETQRLLREKLTAKGVDFHENIEVIFPIMYRGRIAGAAARNLSTGEDIVYRCNAVVLACGGVGSLVKNSSYPEDDKAGYIPFALLAGASIVDMEFVQTEPCTCMSHPAIMNMPVPCGFFTSGAKLLNNNGERFIQKYGYETEGGLLKAILVHAITTEINEGRGTPEGGVYYDATNVAESKFVRFESKNIRLAKAGLSFKDTPLMVRPGPHSHMGGVLMNAKCETGVPGLFVGGESGSGVHGAARMAGCGGTTALVFGKIAGDSAAEYLNRTPGLPIQEEEWEAARTGSVDRAERFAAGFSSDRESMHAISAILKQAVGPERDGETIRRCLNDLKETTGKNAESPDFESVRVFGAVKAAEAIMTAALMREETRGCHYRKDFPEENEKWKARIAFRLMEDGTLESRIIPCN